MIVNMNECNPFNRCIRKDDVASDTNDETNLKEVCEPSGTMDKRFTICERYILSSTAKYRTLKENMLELLVTGIERTLTEATKWNALRVQKCRFNGLDYMGEILWNSNPRRFSRSSSWLSAWDIPLFKRWMHLRAVFPKSWLWSEEEAALLLQKQVRGWLVRKREDVQEMRQFWKDFMEEKAKKKRMNGNYSKGNC